MILYDKSRFSVICENPLKDIFLIKIHETAFTFMQFGVKKIFSIFIFKNAMVKIMFFESYWVKSILIYIKFLVEKLQQMVNTT